MFLEAVLWSGTGLIIGSFTNVLIFRHETGHSLGGRSACRQCGKTLQWFELVPILSWLMLRGRCRTCKAWISLQYPLVEALTAIGFLAVGFAPIPLVLRILGCATVMFLIAITVVDIRHMHMPDAWVFSFAALALISSVYSLFLFTPEGEWLPYIFLFASGPFVALPLWFLWFVSRGTWMGYGDVKFALGIGWLLGTWYGFIALMFSFVIGAIVGVCILLPLERIIRTLRRVRPGFTPMPTSEKSAWGFTMKSEVPFGPFLILSTCIVWFSIFYSLKSVLMFPEALLFWNSWW